MALELREEGEKLFLLVLPKAIILGPCIATLIHATYMPLIRATYMPAERHK